MVSGIREPAKRTIELRSGSTHHRLIHRAVDGPKLSQLLGVGRRRTPPGRHPPGQRILGGLPRAGLIGHGMILDSASGTEAVSCRFEGTKGSKRPARSARIVAADGASRRISPASSRVRPRCWPAQRGTATVVSPAGLAAQLAGQSNRLVMRRNVTRASYWSAPAARDSTVTGSSSRWCSAWRSTSVQAMARPVALAVGAPADGHRLPRRSDLGIRQPCRHLLGAGHPIGSAAHPDRPDTLRSSSGLQQRLVSPRARGHRGDPHRVLGLPSARSAGHWPPSPRGASGTSRSTMGPCR